MADLFNSFEKLNGKYRVKYYGQCNRGDSTFTYELRGPLQATFIHICHYVIDSCVEKKQLVIVHGFNNGVEIIGINPWSRSCESHLVWLEKEG